MKKKEKQLDQILALEGLRQWNCDVRGLKLSELSIRIDLIGMMGSRKEDEMIHIVNENT